MSDQLIVERGGLEKKDKSELQAIVSALGGSVSSRARKADLIDQILELAGATTSDDAGPSDSDPESESHGGGPNAAQEPEAGPGPDDSAPNTLPGIAGPSGPIGASETRAVGTSGAEAREAGQGSSQGQGQASSDNEASRRGQQRSRGNRRGRPDQSTGPNGAGHPVGPDGEPLADWEVAMLEDADGGPGQDRSGQAKGRPRPEGARSEGSRPESRRDLHRGETNRGETNRGETNRGDANRADPNRADPNRADVNRGGADDDGDDGDDTEPNNRRNRRRGRGRGRERDDAGNDPVSSDPVPVDGYLDLRDEGYGFLRVAGNLPSKEDVYVSVKQVRQFGLRRGDHMTGTSRPANRNEKNPGFHQIDTVNGKPPEEARNRAHFEDLTPLFPDEKLVMEMREEPLNMTTRIIDLVAPIGKGQRGLIVSPPKAGKTTVLKDVARAIETNNPEVHLLVLLLDERPEEVTDMERHLVRGEVAASTFDRPPEEHCAVAELTIERAKRLVEQGEDVVIIVDGITRLARAYNLVAPQTGRSMSGGLDAAALYPPKRFFGAARNLEEGGSLTILATALIDTGSRMDEVIFEEFKGTGNAEIRLDRRLAEKRIFPAIDIDGSSTRHEELLYGRAELQQAWKLRRVLSGMSEEGSSAAAIDMLVDRLRTFRTNADFLAEIGKAPSV